MTLEPFQGRYCGWKVNPTTVTRMLRSGELARLCGVSTDTLRHYEDVGVLPKPHRTGAGYRQYPLGAAERVRIVRHPPADASVGPVPAAGL